MSRGVGEVYKRQRLGHIPPHIERQPLEAINDIVARLHAAEIKGRMVLTP